MANFYLAFDLELAVVPVLNKIDLPAADPEKVAEQVQQVCTTLWGKEPWRQLCQPDKCLPILTHFVTGQTHL